MSRDASIELNWPDELRTYRLRIGELRQLQEKCGNSGPQEILDRLSTGKWKVDDVIQTIRLGCVGAGMTQADALKFQETHVHDGNLAEALLPAMAILSAVIVGAPDEEIDQGRRKASNPGKDRTSAKPSSSASSTGRGRRSESARSKSIN